MAEFAYNNDKNVSTAYTPFKLNCGYHSWVSYEENINPRSKSKWADELLAELQELMTISRKNFYYAQKLQKQAHNKSIKLKNYTFGNKVWLNSKYIKTK